MTCCRVTGENSKKKSYFSSPVYLLSYPSPPPHLFTCQKQSIFHHNTADINQTKRWQRGIQNKVLVNNETQFKSTTGSVSNHRTISNPITAKFGAFPFLTFNSNSAPSPNSTSKRRINSYLYFNAELSLNHFPLIITPSKPQTHLKPTC